MEWDYSFAPNHTETVVSTSKEVCWACNGQLCHVKLQNKNKKYKTNPSQDPMQLSPSYGSINLIANTEHSQGEVKTKGLQGTYMNYISPEGTDICYGNWCNHLERKNYHTVLHIPMALPNFPESIKVKEKDKVVNQIDLFTTA